VPERGRVPGVIRPVSRVTGRRQITDFRGLGSKAPIAAFTLDCVLVQPHGNSAFAGFVGKYLIFRRGGAARRPSWKRMLAVIGVLNSAVSLFYYARS